MTLHKLTIIVPFRNREEHLSQFIPHMQKFLLTQPVNYEILIVEQEEGKPFNRAKLLNVGVDNSKDSDYYCFHDVDMLPIDSDYTYCPVPTHLASRASQFGWKLPYNEYFGGVTIFDNNSFAKINGYSNEYWGYGGEDDSIFNRCVFNKIKIARKNCSFKSLDHERIIDPVLHSKNVELLQKNEKDINTDGMSSLKYELISKEFKEGYTHIKVSI